jgi:hypothetical protein
MDFKPVKDKMQKFCLICYTYTCLKMKIHLKVKLLKIHPIKPLFIILPLSLCPIVLLIYFFISQQNKISELEKKTSNITQTKVTLDKQLASISGELFKMKSEDQFVRNEKLQEEIKNIETTYIKSVSVYENLLSLQELSNKTQEYEKLFAESLTLLSKRNFASASGILIKLDSQIKNEKDKIIQTSAVKIAENIPSSNSPPSSGYSRQNVSVDGNTFTVDIVSADLNSTRVIVDTASDSDCSNNCPVLPLSDYVSRSGAFAGVNGSYFCPDSYPSCAGKTNSYDTLAMNKNKKYFNSDNNVYSNVPAVIFLGNSMRFVGRSLEWGRDTGVDGVLANYPLLVSGGQVAFGGNDDPKQGSKGSRSFVGSTGNIGYIGVVHNVTVAESARVLKALGISDALNLDSGGSTALWVGGYKVGPGRNLPNAILFVKK